MSIWSTIGLGKDYNPVVTDEGTEIDLATAYSSWSFGIRLDVGEYLGSEETLNRENAVLLRDRLNEAIERLDEE